VGAIGKTFSTTHQEKPFIGAIVQERVNGIPFSKVLERLDRESVAYPILKRHVGQLITGLRRFHAANELAAFTWHRLDSDNVVAEIDATGELTGRVVVLDGNFTERPDAIYKNSVMKKLNKNIFAKLEEIFEL
jgi:hypothetical protein